MVDVLRGEGRYSGESRQEKNTGYELVDEDHYCGDGAKENAYDEAGPDIGSLPPYPVTTACFAPVAYEAPGLPA